MIDRSRKPIEQVEFKFNPPSIEYFTLHNGLNVYFVPRHHLPVMRINLLVNAGSKFDPEHKKGVANLLTMTFDEGAGNLNGLELSDEFELLGSNFDTGCNNDNIFLSLRSLKENFDRSLQLFSDVLLRPHLDDISFAREKRKILTRVLQLKDQPDEIANQVFEFVVFGENNPYAYPTSGTDLTITNINHEDIRKFYKEYLVPNNSSLVVVGDMKTQELKDKLNKYFNEWQNAPLNASPDYSANKSNFQIFLINKEDAVQTEIRAGHLTPKRDRESYMAKMILNSVFGGQFSSRINLNLREQKGYTYGASSSFNYYRDSGYFLVSTSVGRENSLKAVEEIIKELNLLKEGITPEELSFTRSSILRKFPSTFETNRQIAINITRMIIHSLPLNHFDTYLDQVNTVTLQEINNTAKEAILPDNLSIVVVGDKKTIYEQMTQLNLGSIVELDHEGRLIL